MGSDADVRRAAILYSLVRISERHDVNAWEYLRDVLMRLSTHPASQIDDLYQESVAKCLAKLHTVRDAERLRGWIYQLVRHTCLDHLRRQAARPIDLGGGSILPHLGARGEGGRNPADRLLSRERTAAIERAIERLPASQREALLLRIRHDMDHTQIAQHLGISREAVEVRLCRARSALKSALDAILDGDT